MKGEEGKNKKTEETIKMKQSGDQARKFLQQAKPLKSYNQH